MAKIIVITAKEKACFMDKPQCDPVSCVFANGHFDRINSALYDILENETVISYETIKRYSAKHTVCPYELSLDTALWSDVIICDYNYAFDPRVYLRRFFSETSENFVFLVDEAHNLVDRARDMYSAGLNTYALKTVEKKMGKRVGELKKILGDMIINLMKLAEEITEKDFGLRLQRPPREIFRLCRDFCRCADTWLMDNRQKKPKYYDDILEVYFDFGHFLSILDTMNERYVCYCEKLQKNVLLKLFCADPSERIGERLDKASAAVFFSATLAPIDYFKSLLGAKEDALAYRLPSPFAKENLNVIICSGISAKYKKRKFFYEDIADYIYSAATKKPGNYFAFFPSYVYMESVFGVFAQKYPLVETMLQRQDMSGEEREEFLERFVDQEEHPFVCFAVLGGVFSEGIDLPGKRLIGAFVISVGLPQVSFERLIISDYFGKINGKGFEYSYVYPGLNKVMQAGGRVIRSAYDKGIIVLLDERFLYSSYNSILYECWNDYQVVRRLEDFERAISSFWDLE